MQVPVQWADDHVVCAYCSTSTSQCATPGNVGVRRRRLDWRRQSGRLRASSSAWIEDAEVPNLGVGRGVKSEERDGNLRM